MTPSRHTLLVTGFGGFPGSPRNPTETLAVALRRQAPRLARLGVDLRCAVLPVLYRDLPQRLDALARLHRPDTWLMLGVAGRRRHLCIEMLARNRANPLRPDAGGHRPPQRLVAGGARLHRSSLPAPRLLASLRLARLPARLSNDAGDYLCNAALYHARDAVLAARIGFLHVPMPGGARSIRIGSGPALRQPRRLGPPDLLRAAVLSALVLARGPR